MNTTQISPGHPPDILQTPPRHLQGTRDANRWQQTPTDTKSQPETPQDTDGCCLSMSGSVSLRLLVSFYSWRWQGGVWRTCGGVWGVSGGVSEGCLTQFLGVNVWVGCLFIFWRETTTRHPFRHPPYTPPDTPPQNLTNKILSWKPGNLETWKPGPPKWNETNWKGKEINWKRLLIQIPGPGPDNQFSRFPKPGLGPGLGPGFKLGV